MRERFHVREIGKCMCGMRQFAVWDNSTHTEEVAHVGLLNYLNLGHQAVVEVLRAERAKVADQSVGGRDE